MSPLLPLALLSVVAADIEGAGRLAPFFDALGRLERGAEERVRITHLGDSHVAADQWTSPVRQALQERFGDGGRGFVLAGRAWRSYWQGAVRHDSPGPWRVDGLRGGLDDGQWVPGGCSLAASSPSAATRIEAARIHPTVEVHYLRQPAGGCLDVRGDGTEVTRLSTRGPWIAPAFRRIEPPGGVRTVELRPAGGGEARLLGVDLLDHRGVVYDALGINGARVRALLAVDPIGMAAILGRLSPALVILSYGANELFDGNLTRERYAEELGRALDRVRRSAPAAACLLTAPPDMLRRGRQPEFAEVLREVQRSLASAHGCAFWDAREAMGGAGSIRRWLRLGLARRDYVHLTRDGYRQLADALFSSLVGSYETYGPVGRPRVR